MCWVTSLVTSDTTPNKDNWLLTGHWWGTKHTHLLHLVTWFQLVCSPYLHESVANVCVPVWPLSRNVSRIISPEKEHVLCYHQ